jgi:hypothetical protein
MHNCKSSDVPRVPLSTHRCNENPLVRRAVTVQEPAISRRLTLRTSAAIVPRVVLTLLAGAPFVFSATRSSAVELPNALVPAIVEIPPSLRTAPLDQDRILMVPPGFKISVLARIPGREIHYATADWRDSRGATRARKHFHRSASS